MIMNSNSKIYSAMKDVLDELDPIQQSMKNEWSNIFMRLLINILNALYHRTNWDMSPRISKDLTSNKE